VGLLGTAANGAETWKSDAMAASMRECSYNNAVDGMLYLGEAKTDGMNVVGQLARVCAEETGFMRECQSAKKTEQFCAGIALVFAKAGIERAEAFYGIQSGGN